MEETAQPRPAQWTSFKKWARTIHIYLSVFAFALLLFFGVTGFLMNHPDWFGLDETETEKIQGTIPDELLEKPDKPVLVAFLRDKYGLQGEPRSFEVEGEEIYAVFRRPGAVSDVSIDRKHGDVYITIERGGFLQALSHIHRGENVGPSGALLIDLAAVLLVVTSVGGLILWMTLSKRRRVGLIVLAVGSVFFLGFCWLLMA